MTSATLNEVIHDGAYIRLMDGSVWWINPGDISTVCTWAPTVEIKISHNDDPIFDHALTNKTVGVSVRAMKCDSAASK